MSAAAPPPARPPVGLYVHLPFCASRCAYCTFVVTTRRGRMGDYLTALRREASLVDLPAGATLATLYLGGGTPSLVPPDDLAALVADLTGRWPLVAGAEVTAEANPEDVTPELLRTWAAAGVNRVSLGVQSFEDAELAALDRRHAAATAVRAAQSVLESGAFELSLDLILAVPDQDRASAGRSLDRLLALAPHHVSVYLLEMDKPHRLQALARSDPGRFAAPDDAAELYLDVHARLGDAGYEHYEVSSFARPGRRARHNTRYWERRPVHALGVAAHGADGAERWANRDDLRGYLEAVGRDERPLAHRETLTAGDLALERVLLGLRLAEGVEEAAVGAAGALRPGFAAKLADFVDLGLARRAGGRVALTPRGWLLSNELFEELV